MAAVPLKPGILSPPRKNLTGTHPLCYRLSDIQYPRYSLGLGTSALSLGLAAEVLPMAPILSAFPAPEALAEYEEIVPGFTQTLVDEVINHRKALERAEENAHVLTMRRLQLEAEVMKRGQIFGLAIGIVAILAGSISATFGASLAGGFIGGGGVIGLVAVFVAQNRNTNIRPPTSPVAVAQS
jgi:uncharacterized membrane protein